MKKNKMDMNDVYKKFDKFKFIVEKMNYLDKIKTGIEKHPKLVSEKTKESVELVDLILNYENETSNSAIGTKVSEQDREIISKYYEFRAEKEISNLIRNENSWNKEINDGMWEHSTSYRALHLIENKSRFKAQHYKRSAENFVKAYKMDEKEHLKNQAIDMYVKASKLYLANASNPTEEDLRCDWKKRTEMSNRHINAAKMMEEAHHLNESDKRLRDKAASLYERAGDFYGKERGFDYNVYVAINKYEKALRLKPEDDNLYKKVMEANLDKATRGYDESKQEESIKLFESFIDTYMKLGEKRKVYEIKNMLASIISN